MFAPHTNISMGRFLDVVLLVSSVTQSTGFATLLSYFALRAIMGMNSTPLVFDAFPIILTLSVVTNAIITAQQICYALGRFFIPGYSSLYSYKIGCYYRVPA